MSSTFGNNDELIRVIIFRNPNAKIYGDNPNNHRNFLFRNDYSLKSSYVGRKRLSSRLFSQLQWRKEHKDTKSQVRKPTVLINQTVRAYVYHLGTSGFKNASICQKIPIAIARNGTAAFDIKELMRSFVFLPRNVF